MPHPTEHTRERRGGRDVDTLSDAVRHDGEGRRAPAARARDAGAFGVGLLLGLAVGGALALLFAPQTGDETRARIGRRAHQLRGRLVDRWDDLRDDVRRGARRGTKKLGHVLADRTWGG